MPKFAVVFDNAVREIRDFPEQPVCKMIDGLPTVRPFVEKTPAAGEKRGGYIIFDDRVERELLAKTQEDLDADKLNEASALEMATVRLFFKLCKALLAAGVLNVNDPNLAEIKTAYLRWKNLTGN